MKISMIAAMTKNKVIGANNSLPWHISEDLQYFKRTTLGKPIVMGRKTFESKLLNKKPLPKRKNIVLTKENKNVYADIHDVIVVNNIEDAIKECEQECKQSGALEAMIIGGAEIYKAFLPIADRLYLSLIHENYNGDTYFPEYENLEWQVVSEEKHEQFTSLVLDRVK